MVVAEEHLGRRPAGVGHANIDAAELLRDSLDKRFDRGSIGYIQRLGDYRDAVAFTMSPAAAFSFVGIARAHGHFRAFGGEFFRRRAGDAIARSSDNYITVLQSQIHLAPPWLLVCTLTKIGVVFVDPILPWGIKDVQVDRILERDGLMRHMGRDA